VKNKAKKATAGQRFVGIPDYCHTAEEAQAMVRAAQAIDRAIAAAVRKERKRCVAWVEQLIKDNEDIIRKLGHSQRRMENEHSIEDLALVRSHIKSGEKLP
jgi:hypothetical protein